MGGTVREYGNDNLGLFVLPPPGPEWEKRHGQPRLDVVAVHGLNGDCFETWTSRSATGEKTTWLNELLPQKLPQTRVMTFGYNAGFVSTSTARVRDDARKLLVLLRNRREDDGTHRRPIVFVAHSLGGIIVKQALLLARNEWKTFSSIADCARGIVFFGTPHRGSDAAQWGELIAGVKAVAFGGRIKSPFFRFLRPNSDDLMDLSEDFRPIAQNFALHSFVEEDVYGRLGKVIVQKNSAVMEIPGEEFAYIHGDHSSMCKFSKDDGRFDAVWRAIRRAAQGPETAKTVEIRGVYKEERPQDNQAFVRMETSPQAVAWQQSRSSRGITYGSGPVNSGFGTQWAPVAEPLPSRR